MNAIEILTDRYTDNAIIAANAFTVQSIAGDELEFDRFDATLDLSAYRPVALAPTDADVLADMDSTMLTVRPWVRVLVADPAAYAYGTPLLAYHDDMLLGKFYMQSCKRVSRYSWAIEAVSPIGLLAKSTHYGGVYSGSASTFAFVLADIIGGVVPYTLNPALAGQPVRGWLPVATRRENLHQLLVAMGAVAQNDGNGDLYITTLEPLAQAAVKEVPDRRIYAGGRAVYPDKAALVVLHEHNFAAVNSVALQQVFSGAITAEEVVSPSGQTYTGGMLIFDEPLRSYSVTGASILASGANWLILSGGNNVTVEARPYVHSVRRVEKGDHAAAEENTVTYEDATLVNPLNSATVLDRLYAYHAAADLIEMDIVVEDEHAGDAVTFADPFGDPAAGYLAELGVAVSGILKGAAQVVTNYQPSSGNTYDNCDIIVTDGAWTVPPGVEKVKLVIINPGDHGHPGDDGEDGTPGSDNGYGKGGKGGAGNRGGYGGKMLTVDLAVTPGETITLEGLDSLDDDVAATYDGNVYTARRGERSATGYTDPFYSHVFALPGDPGVAGGDGDPGAEPVEWNGITYLPGSKGDDGEWEE